LACRRGAINIKSVHFDGVRGDEDSIKKVKEYCEKQIDSAHIVKRCVVSLQMVFEIKYPENKMTDVYYECLPK